MGRNSFLKSIDLFIAMTIWPQHNHWMALFIKQDLL